MSIKVYKALPPKKFNVWIFIATCLAIIYIVKTLFDEKPLDHSIPEGVV